MISISLLCICQCVTSLPTLLFFSMHHRCMYVGPTLFFVLRVEIIDKEEGVEHAISHKVNCTDMKLPFLLLLF
ncbi:hypothetical protein BKA57DRAFT_476741 [Linnemannia elongata]|nr:hypothetical protein BKA57DRAFT_476741 [Linnemannia elongata]